MNSPEQEQVMTEMVMRGHGDAALAITHEILNRNFDNLYIAVQTEDGSAKELVSLGLLGNWLAAAHAKTQGELGGRINDGSDHTKTASN
jgi:hypothetical protein